MEIIKWYYMGLAIFILDICWILFYYYFASVKVYNLYQKKDYRYMGVLWIKKKRGFWYLKIPKEMIENSVTTEYKLVSCSGFHRRRKGENLYLDFDGKYEVKVSIFKEITVKNYIETSHQL